MSFANFVCLVLMVASGASPVFGQNNPGAPAWIKPGMRITFYSASATTGAGEILEPDDLAMEKERQKAQKKADETGETQHYTYWKDRRGQQYSLNESPGVSGEGFIELNVVAIDETTAALETRIYGKDTSTGVVRAPAPTGQVVAAHTGGDYWIHPALLRQMVGREGEGVSVRTTTCTVRDRTYQAVQIRTRNDAGCTQRTYDASTGVLLRLSSATSHGASAWVPDPGGTSHRGGGGTTLTEAWLVGTRQLKLPWIGLPAPEWVQRTRMLRYAGTQGATVPGSGTMGFPLTVQIAIRRCGPGWIEFTESARIQSPYGMPPPQTENARAAGTNQIGGFWIPPEALARLNPGQQLDSDPVTKVRFTVERADASRVLLQEAGAEHRTQFVYERKSGLLVATSQQQQVGATTAQFSVELQGRE